MDWRRYHRKLPDARDIIVSSTRESLDRLNVRPGDIVDAFFLHSPSLDELVVETLKGVDEVYRASAFKKFVLSNSTPAQVQEVLAFCEENGFVLPTVYEGVLLCCDAKA